VDSFGDRPAPLNAAVATIQTGAADGVSDGSAGS
jgi:hypothetical protein